MPTSWRMTDWITASMSITSASAPATASMAPYWPSNQLAVRSGLAVLSTRSPTLPVTQTAVFGHPGGDAAHDEVAGRRGCPAHRSRDGIADVPDDRQLARIRDRADLGARGRGERAGEDDGAEKQARAPRSSSAAPTFAQGSTRWNSSKRGMAANNSPGVAAISAVESGGVGPSELRTSSPSRRLAPTRAR